MYDESGIVSHTNNVSTATSNAESNSHSIVPAVLASGAASNLSNSVSPSASAASADRCSFDSSSADPGRFSALTNNPFLLFPSAAAVPAASASLLPFLSLAQNGGIPSRSVTSNVPFGVNAVVRTQSIDPTMALINTSSLNVKDSRWLKVEVCREFQRGQCSRNEQECKFAHPPPHVEVQNGQVTACYDHLKGRCIRDNPKCKFLHAPQHLKDQLLQNGRNNLAMKNFMTQLGIPATPMIPSAAAATALAASNQFTNLNPYAASVPGAGATLVPGALGTYNPYAYALNAAAVYPGLMNATSQDAFAAYGGILPTSAATSPVSVAAAVAVQHAQKAAIVRADRVEVCREFSRGSCQRGENECKYAHPKPEVDRANDGTVVVCMDYVRKGGGDGACNHKPCRYYHPPPHLLQQVATRLLQMQPAVQQASLMHTGKPSTIVNGNGSASAAVAAESADHSSSATTALLLAYQQHVQQQMLAMQSLQSASTFPGYPPQMQQHTSASASVGSAAAPSALPASSANMQAAAAAQAYAASQLAAIQATSGSVSKKRPLEPDTMVQQITANSVAAAATDPLLLAAAALQNAPVNKRAAMDKGGVPVYQHMTPVNAAAMNALQYPQLAATAFPGIQTSYVPLTFAGHPPGVPRF